MRRAIPGAPPRAFRPLDEFPRRIGQDRTKIPAWEPIEHSETSRMRGWSMIATATDRLPRDCMASGIEIGPQKMWGQPGYRSDLEHAPTRHAPPFRGGLAGQSELACNGRKPTFIAQTQYGRVYLIGIRHVNYRPQVTKRDRITMAQAPGQLAT